MSKEAGAAAFRKSWDKEAFEIKAKARLDEELKLEEEREANIQAPQPIVQRAPLQRREQDLQLTKFVNTRQMVTLGQAANGEMTGVYYCKVLATAACAIPATAHARPPATVALLSTISLQSQYDLATAPPPPRRPAATPPGVRVPPARQRQLLAAH